MSGKRRAVVLLVAALALAGCSAKPKANSSRPVVKLVDKSAAEILAAATGAATAKGSVHTEANSKQGGTTGLIVNDTGTKDGRQVLTSGAQRMEVRLVDGIAYVHANRAALLGAFQFPAAAATKYANKWLSFTSSDEGFDDIAETLDMPTLVTSITLTGALTKTTVTTIDGQQVIGVSGNHPQGGTATLYVAIEGDPLPVQLAATIEGEKTTVVFSRWGAAVNVSAPSGAISISAVTA